MESEWPFDDTGTYRDARIEFADCSGAEIKESRLNGVRMIGVEMVGAEIDGYISGLIVNGVSVMPLVDAELDRLTISSDQRRASMRPDGHGSPIRQSSSACACCSTKPGRITSLPPATSRPSTAAPPQPNRSGSTPATLGSVGRRDQGSFVRPAHR